MGSEDVAQRVFNVDDRRGEWSQLSGPKDPCGAVAPLSFSP